MQNVPKTNNTRRGSALFAVIRVAKFTFYTSRLLPQYIVTNESAEYIADLKRINCAFTVFSRLFFRFHLHCKPIDFTYKS